MAKIKYWHSLSAARKPGYCPALSPPRLSSDRPAPGPPPRPTGAGPPPGRALHRRPQASAFRSAGAVAALSCAAPGRLPSPGTWLPVHPKAPRRASGLLSGQASAGPGRPHRAYLGACPNQPQPPQPPAPILGPGGLTRLIPFSASSAPSIVPELSRERVDVNRCRTYGLLPLTSRVRLPALAAPVRGRRQGFAPKNFFQLLGPAPGSKKFFLRRSQTRALDSGHRSGLRQVAKKEALVSERYFGQGR